MGLIALLGRILFSSLFILASFGHFTQDTIDYAALRGVPMPEILVPLSGILALLGGLSVLFGYKARWGAWLLVIFLLPVTLMMHNFWDMPEPAADLEKIMFMKNMAVLGGALLIAYFGSGPFSLSRERQ